MKPPWPMQMMLAASDAAGTNNISNIITNMLHSKHGLAAVQSDWHQAQAAWFYYTCRQATEAIAGACQSHKLSSFLITFAQKGQG